MCVCVCVWCINIKRKKTSEWQWTFSITTVESMHSQSAERQWGRNETEAMIQPTNLTHHHGEGNHSAFSINSFQTTPNLVFFKCVDTDFELDCVTASTGKCSKLMVLNKKTEIRVSFGLMVHVNHIQWKHQHSGRNTHELWIISHIWSYHSYRCHRKWNSATCLCERIGDTTDAHTHTQSHKHTQTHWNWIQLGKERVKVRLSTETYVVNPKSKQKSETSLRHKFR